MVLPGQFLFTDIHGKPWFLVPEAERIGRQNIFPPWHSALLGRCIMRKMVGLAIVASALLVSACNTVEGAGKDVSSAGRTVAKTADGAK
jgi:predicted small secreted protein